MENDIKEAKYSEGTYYFTMIIAIASALTFLVILVCAVVIVPKAVSLIGTAQTTLNNMQTVSEKLMDLELSDTIQNIDDNTSRAMQDVSDSMEKIESLDVESLNQAIMDLSESVENLNSLFGN